MINYNIEEIKEYLHGLDFLIDSRFTSDDTDYVISHIDFRKPLEFDYEIGATKCVIIPEDKDYVIKIPFNGYYQYNFETGKDEFYHFEYADAEENDNYCEAEINIYTEAKDRGFGHLFLPLEFVYMINNIPVYIQEKCEHFLCNSINNNYSSKKSIDILRQEIIEGNFHSGSLSYDWLGSCLDTFDDFNKFKEFFNFLEETTVIRDLHRGNIGYHKGHAIIVDYGGYKEDQI